MNQIERNDLQSTITQVLQEMKVEAGEKFDIDKVNLAELGRRTGISRKKLRSMDSSYYRMRPLGRNTQTPSFLALQKS